MPEQTNDYAYLTAEHEVATAVMKNISTMGERLKELKSKMLAAEAAYDIAKKEYEHYASTVLPSEMAAAGVDSISLSTGGALTLKHNFYCQPNKNAADRRAIVEWLRAHGGGHLVEHDATVAADDFTKLEQTGIPFVENVSVNTTKLKSFLKDGIGANGGAVQFSMEDIPACAHFSEVVSVDVQL